MKNKKIFIIVLIIFSILFLVSSGVYFYYRFNGKIDDQGKISENNNDNNKNVEEERMQLTLKNQEWIDKFPKIKNVYLLLHQKDWFFPSYDLITTEYYSRDITKNTDLTDVTKVSLVMYYEYNNEKREEMSQLESTPYYSEDEFSFDKCIEKSIHNESVYKLGCGERLYVVFNIEKNQVDTYLNNYFGKDNGYIDTNVDLGSCVVELRFNSNSNMYTLYTGGGCGGIGNLIYGYYSKISNIEEKDKEIYVTEKILYTEVKTTDNISIINVYDKKDGTLIGNASYNSDFSVEEADKITNDYFKKYSDKLNEYKYTFKQNEEGNYYFYSIELIK